ncbi:fibronectin type III domain-containing protein [Marinilabilia salmonicolor]|uniref:fibronectin type III domain-containing protein n=1 Tax=Marinilabilia salmonicolor TaxID=989 RepID=UPI00046A1B21|nr:fibronectin type III domain-containing protein [Marinilabilia salmonicolor]
MPEWLTTDYSGRERIQGGIVDIGVFEGVVLSPELFSPANDAGFEADQNSVVLEWGWSGTQPDGVESYTLEYRINEDDPVSVEDPGSFSYTLTGLNPNSVVQWRVAGVDASGNQSWSQTFYFWISRGHPLYVTPNGTGNGSSWNDAMNLQSALDEARRGDAIWVAAGTYYPTNTSERYSRFKLKEQVKLFGGFAGGESTLAERNWSLNETILSGNIGDKESKTDNSELVVEAIGTSANPLTEETVLDGFIIEDGYGNQTSGIFMEDASIIVRNVWIRDNYSSTAGGAVRSSYGSNPKFGNVLFTNNISMDNGGRFIYPELPNFIIVHGLGIMHDGRGLLLWEMLPLLIQFPGIIIRVLIVMISPIR